MLRKIFWQFDVNRKLPGRLHLRHFRQLAGIAGYDGGFIDHYFMPIVYPAGLTRGMQIAFGVTILAVNLFVYARVLVDRTKQGNGRTLS